MFTLRKTFISICLVGFVGTTIACFWLLSQSYTGDSVLSPWQIIHPAYIYIFTVATFLLGLLIFFSRLKSFYLLILLIFYLFLLHSYLPLTHSLVWGADAWRHIADEARILSGLPLTPPQLSAPVAAWKVFLGNLSYWQFWFLAVFIAKITSLSLITINVWLIPVLWSIVFPIALFYLGRGLGLSERWSLLLVWLSALPFALQTAGSFTLPVNFGFLVWVVALALLFHQSRKRWQTVTLVALGVLLTFGYALFAILFWLTLAIKFANSFFCHPERSEGSLSVGSKRFFASLRMTALSVVVGCVIPAIELLTHYSHFEYLPWFAQFKQFIGNFTSFYLGTGPRPHDIAMGNILFNQVPSYAFVPNFFTAHLFWLFFFALGFFAVTSYGVYRSFRNERMRPAGILAVGLVMSYIISWYGLGGEHLLARRLDVVLATLFVVLFTFALLSFRTNVRNLCFKIWPSMTEISRSARNDKLLIVFSLAIFSIAIAASYSLGPDTNAVSSDEYTAMAYMWSQEQGSDQHCVVADTYPLLALEALSKKEIVGGGFPINQYFAQPELADLFKAFTAVPTPVLWQRATALTGANTCWLMLPSGQAFKAKPEALMGLRFKQFGKMFVWRYTR